MLILSNDESNSYAVIKLNVYLVTQPELLIAHSCLFLIEGGSCQQLPNNLNTENFGLWQHRVA